MYHQRTFPRTTTLGAAWVLLGLALGLHSPDIDNRLGWLLPSWVLLHRSILTHGLIIPLLLFHVIRRRRGTAPSLRLFVISASLAVAVHLCFDFFPLSWRGFALIHIPAYGRTGALFSQLWMILSIGVCLYVAFRLVRNVAEWALSVGGLIISYTVSAVEEGGAATLALVLLALCAAVTIILARQVRKAEARRA